MCFLKESTLLLFQKRPKDLRKFFKINSLRPLTERNVAQISVKKINKKVDKSLVNTVAHVEHAKGPFIVVQTRLLQLFGLV